jgi:hypothetical protein
MQHTGIVRPRWAVGLTNQEVAAVAKHEGLNPYRLDWFDGLDPVVICEARSGCFRQGTSRLLKKGVFGNHRGNRYVRANDIHGNWITN